MWKACTDIFDVYLPFSSHKLKLRDALRRIALEEKKTHLPHKLMIENRQGGTVTGVSDVISFDEKDILLLTQSGKLSIKGEQLHVKRLNLEKGEVDIEGKIDSLLYMTKNAEKTGESFFKRMFR